MTDYFNGKEGNLSPADAAAAIIVLPNNRYLMQLRDNKPNIFYPGHWGLFGGGVDKNESPKECLSRELREELNLTGIRMKYFYKMPLDFSFCELGLFNRYYFIVEVHDKLIDKLELGEGAEMRVFGSSELLQMPRIVPYDSFAIWMHSAREAINFA